MWPGIPDTYQNLPQSDSGSFRYARSRDYQAATRHALLGHGKRTYSYFDYVHQMPSVRPSGANGAVHRMSGMGHPTSCQHSHHNPLTSVRWMWLFEYNVINSFSFFFSQKSEGARPLLNTPISINVWRNFIQKSVQMTAEGHYLWKASCHPDHGFFVVTYHSQRRSVCVTNLK